MVPGNIDQSDMAQSDIDQGSTAIQAELPVLPEWCRVTQLADLVRIFEPDIQVCAWQREIDPAIAAYLSHVEPAGEQQLLETMTPGSKPALDRLPEAPGREALMDDLVLLRDIICELLACEAVGLRLARIDHAMCPGWHIDRTGIRLVCTYQGPGTEWLDDQDVDRSYLQSPDHANKAFNQAAAGELVLLKGSLWQGNDDFGAVHRSPELSQSEAASSDGVSTSLRTVITLDPLWYE